MSLRRRAQRHDDVQGQCVLDLDTILISVVTPYALSLGCRNSPNYVGKRAVYFYRDSNPKLSDVQSVPSRYIYGSTYSLCSGNVREQNHTNTCLPAKLILYFDVYISGKLRRTQKIVK
jgi:hypothetical protein